MNNFDIEVSSSASMKEYIYNIYIIYMYIYIYIYMYIYIVYIDAYALCFHMCTHICLYNVRRDRRGNTTETKKEYSLYGYALHVYPIRRHHNESLSSGSFVGSQSPHHLVVVGVNTGREEK